MVKLMAFNDLFIGLKALVSARYKLTFNGVIFSDGIENDYLDFNFGSIARIGIAKEKVNLVVQ